MEDAYRGTKGEEYMAQIPKGKRVVSREDGRECSRLTRSGSYVEDSLFEVSGSDQRNTREEEFWARLT